MKDRIASTYRVASALASRLVGTGPAFGQLGQSNRPRETSDEVLKRRQRRQPWLGAFFVGLVVAGWFYPLLASVGVLAMLAGAIGLGLVRGRYWCNWFCPRGSFFDSVLRRVSRGRKAPAFFHHPLFRLGWMLWFTFVVVTGVASAWGDPAGMSAPFARLMVVSTGIAIVLGVTFHERAWCMFCPMGTMGNMANRLAKLLGRDIERQVIIDPEACVDCRRCHSACRQQIKPNEHKRDQLVDHGDVFALTAGRNGARREPSGDVIDHGDCLKCGYCVDECPTDALRFGELGTDEDGQAHDASGNAS